MTSWALQSKLLGVALKANGSILFWLAFLLLSTLLLLCSIHYSLIVYYVLFFIAGTIFAYGVTSSGKTHTMHVRWYICAPPSLHIWYLKCIWKFVFLKVLIIASAIQWYAARLDNVDLVHCYSYCRTDSWPSLYNTSESWLLNSFSLSCWNSLWFINVHIEWCLCRKSKISCDNFIISRCIVEFHLWNFYSIIPCARHF